MYDNVQDEAKGLDERMARKTKEDAEKTYRALLDAAIVLFNRQGVSKTTLNDIAKQAGMTRGAVYWHFENKESVIKALWKKYAEVEINTFMKAIEDLPDTKPLEYFKSQIVAFLQNVFFDPKISQSVRIIHSCREFTDEESELQLFFKKHHREYQNSLLTCIRKLCGRGEFSPKYGAEFITNGIRIFILGIVEAKLEVGLEKMEYQCEQYVNVFIQAFQKA